jgi:hypothetical protein
MIHIKHTAHPINVKVLSEAESMASDLPLEVSTLGRDALAEATQLQSFED